MLLYRAAGCHMKEKKESVLEGSETKSALDKKTRKAPGKKKTECVWVTERPEAWGLRGMLQEMTRSGRSVPVHIGSW